MQSRYPDDMPELLAVAEVAAWLKVHPNTIRRWAERGLINAYRIGPGGIGGSTVPRWSSY